MPGSKQQQTDEAGRAPTKDDNLKATEKSAPSQNSGNVISPGECPGGCGFMTTHVHPTHCCVACYESNGQHGTRCHRIRAQISEERGNAAPKSWRHFPGVAVTRPDPPSPQAPLSAVGTHQQANPVQRRGLSLDRPHHIIPLGTEGESKTTAWAASEFERLVPIQAFCPTSMTIQDLNYKSFAD